MQETSQEFNTCCNSIQLRADATDYLDPNLAFQTVGEDFWCGFIDVLTDDLALVQPEFVFGEVGVQEQIQVIFMVATGSYW
ncbi:hypothetical protein EAF04_009480 [Stromatinia cepivora]|nr:hypothetical protein EAF04_009480 [Stromatinia cepivora]